VIGQSDNYVENTFPIFNPLLKRGQRGIYDFHVSGGPMATGNLFGTWDLLLRFNPGCLFSNRTFEFRQIRIYLIIPERYS
jgi:hypothetical protein